MNYQDHLETERLITRFLTQDDISVWTTYFADPVNCTFISNDRCVTPGERAQEWINFIMKRYAENRFGLQALIHKESGAFIGMCGLLLQEVEGKNEIEVGYHLLRKYWGYGYATEAAQLFRDYGFEHRVTDTLISLIHPLNFQSKKVAQRNGMKMTRQGVEYRGKECDVFAITREEWEVLEK